MKKLISFTLLISVLLFTPQLFAQDDLKSKENKKASDKKTEPNATDAKSGEKIMIGGYTKSGKKISPPRTTQEPVKDPTGTVTVGSAKYNPHASGSIVYDRMGNIMATVGANGMIYDAKGNPLGQYTSKGEYLKPNGEKIGSIQGGVIRTKDGKEIGRLSEDGKVTNARGKLLGIIYDDGTIRNSKGSRLGSAPGVDKNISVLIFFNMKKPSSKGKNIETKPVFKLKPL